MTWRSSQVDIPAGKILGMDISDQDVDVLRASYTSVGKKILADVETSCVLNDVWNGYNRELYLTVCHTII